MTGDSQIAPTTGGKPPPLQRYIERKFVGTGNLGTPKAHFIRFGEPLTSTVRCSHAHTIHYFTDFCHVVVGRGLARNPKNSLRSFSGTPRASAVIKVK